MTMKADDPPTHARKIDEWDGGFGWIAHPEEEMLRASHALATDEGVWLIDPVDVPDLDEWLTEFGEVAGVVALVGRHTRDAAEVANRYDVPVYLPEPLSSARKELDARVELFGDELPGTGYRTITLLDTPVWTEIALYDDESATLLVPESVGTAEFFRAPGERLGVHPARRLVPPTPLRGFVPERILVGHGEGITEDASGALREALSGSRRNAAKLYTSTLKNYLPL
ncbi:hypothetical protein [Halalkalicoccus ordinarius]|uniref:hypothetical protein n=1 Tax=Halalkalicoccus ordinarius TaxID=3116651 RepID=UPI00300E7861